VQIGTRIVILGFMVLSAVFVGCHSGREVKPVQNVSILPSQTPINSTASREPSLRGKDYKEVAEVRMVHFDFAKSTLDAENRDILKNNYTVMARHADWEYLIEGRCDERGTEAYNLGLGQRRATAVRQYYIALGADGRRIATISYGKESPLCTEHNEACWSQNRSAASKVREWDEAPKSI